VTEGDWVEVAFFAGLAVIMWVLPFPRRWRRQWSLLGELKELLPPPWAWPQMGSWFHERSVTVRVRFTGKPWEEASYLVSILVAAEGVQILSGYAYMFKFTKSLWVPWSSISSCTAERGMLGRGRRTFTAARGRVKLTIHGEPGRVIASRWRASRRRGRHR
jgi:hypothetical protein